MGQSLPLGLLLGVGLVLLCSCCQLTAWLCPGAKDTMTVGYRIGRCKISSSSSTEQRPSAAGGSDHSNIRFSLWSPVAPAPRRHLHFSYLRKQGAAWALIALLWPPIFRSRAVREVRADEESGRRKARGLVIFAAGFQAFPWVASELCEGLAQRGYIVAAPDFCADENIHARLRAVEAVLDCVLSDSGNRLDAGDGRVVCVGHSRGGCQAALLAMADRRVCAAVMLSCGSGETETLLRAHLDSEQQPQLGDEAHTHRQTSRGGGAGGDDDVSPPFFLVAAADDEPQALTDSWVEFLGRTAPDSRRFIARVAGPAGHNWCTSLAPRLSFALPRCLSWALAALSRSCIPALTLLYPDGVTAARARELSGLAAAVVGDFVDAAVAPPPQQAARDTTVGDGVSSVAPATPLQWEAFEEMATELEAERVWSLSHVR